MNRRTDPARWGTIRFGSAHPLRRILRTDRASALALGLASLGSPRRSETSGSLAMQKVVGLNPISRFEQAPPRRGFLMAQLIEERTATRLGSEMEAPAEQLPTLRVDAPLPATT